MVKDEWSCLDVGFLMWVIDGTTSVWIYYETFNNVIYSDMEEGGKWITIS